MPYVVTNPTWFTAFNNGTFESGGSGTAGNGAGVSINTASTAEAQGGTRSCQVNCLGVDGGASVSGNGFNRQQNLVKFKSGNAIVAGRRYTINFWMKVTNDGESAPTHTIKILLGLGLDGFPAIAQVALDFRAVISIGGWVNGNITINPPASIAASDATLSIIAKWNSPLSPAMPAPSVGPLTGAMMYFDTISIVEEEFIATPPHVVSGVVTNATNGGADGEIDVSVSGGTGPFSYAWSDGPTTQDRVGLPAGTYTVTVLDTATLVSVSKSFTVDEYAALIATAVVNNPTADGASDGAIFITPSGGSGSYSYSWADGPTTQNRSGLVEGTYTITVTDTVTGQQFILPVELTDPGPPVYPGSFISVPTMQSLHFVNVSAIDNCDNPQGLDNVLFCSQFYPYYSKVPYFQKVCKCDRVGIQWNSDFENFTIQLKDYMTNAVVKNFSFTLKEENLGKTEEFNVTLKNHTTPGKTRVYFNVGAPPIPLEVGDNFEILNNVDGYDGNYTIVDIIQDTLVGYAYLLINKNYTGPDATSAATGKFDVSTANFNVFESAMSFLDVSDGDYYVHIVATKPGLDISVISEPIKLAVDHVETNVIEFRNFDNAFGMTWQTGYIGKIRVESLFFKRLPGGERMVSRNSDYSLVKVNARKTRVILFETFQLPPYLHEKLSVIFDMDFFSIQGIECQTSEGYGEPQYLTRYPLANSSIKVEVKQWFEEYNSHDLGSINEGGFITTETGFLKR